MAVEFSPVRHHHPPAWSSGAKVNAARIVLRTSDVGALTLAPKFTD
jgi:hypothetical protein